MAAPMEQSAAPRKVFERRLRRMMIDVARFSSPHTYSSFLILCPLRACPAWWQISLLIATVPVRTFGTTGCQKATNKSRCA